MLRADDNTATLAHMLAVGHGIKNQQGNVLTANDFKRWNAEEEAEATPEELAAILGGKR
jgi:type IV secretory pathway VirD2 relaxase